MPNYVRNELRSNRFTDLDFDAMAAADSESKTPAGDDSASKSATAGQNVEGSKDVSYYSDEFGLAYKTHGDDDHMDDEARRKMTMKLSAGQADMSGPIRFGKTADDRLVVVIKLDAALASAPELEDEKLRRDQLAGILG